ncbi:MAG TPA: hypothetical protein VFQ65_16885, partial [Kofleriaceae bacterium]|nr:hypothetical protein [Kofleriaceae bacterium]
KRRLAPWLLVPAVVMAAAAGAWWHMRPEVTSKVAFEVPKVPAPAPASAPTPPAPAPSIASSDPAPEPEIAMPAEPASVRNVGRDKARHKERPRHEHKVASTTAIPVSVPPVPEEVPPPPPPAPPIAEVPIVKPQTINTVIENVAVRGSLSEATVRRAVERIAPAIRQCAPNAPQNIQVHFTIGEARRATNVQASGTAPTSACVVSAFGAMRSETAPDVGDVDVDVQIAYVAR